MSIVNSNLNMSYTQCAKCAKCSQTPVNPRFHRGQIHCLTCIPPKTVFISKVIGTCTVCNQELHTVHEERPSGYWVDNKLMCSECYAAKRDDSNLFD